MYRQTIANWFKSDTTRDSTTALGLEFEETPAALLEDLSLGNSTVSDGIRQERHGKESLASSPIHHVTSMPSSSLELMSSETARDVYGSSSLSENRAVQHDATIDSAPPLSHFHQIVIDKFPDLKCTMLEGVDKNSVSQNSSLPSSCWIYVSCKDCCVNEQQ